MAVKTAMFHYMFCFIVIVHGENRLKNCYIPSNCVKSFLELYLVIPFLSARWEDPKDNINQIDLMMDMTSSAINTQLSIRIESGDP